VSLSRPDLNTVHLPTVIDEFNKRANDFQLRIADQITRFAGSLRFVHLHIVLLPFGWWLSSRSLPSARNHPLTPVISRLNRGWA
jgi:hypothetical protein